MGVRPDARGRCRGALLGLAVGDAVGTTVEFRSPGSFPPVTDMVGGGPFHLPAGAWTNDTSMALCLAASLVENGWDPTGQMTRYVRWWREGYMSSTGGFVDIGIWTRCQLERFERTGAASATEVDPDKAGNGSIMRLAPVPVRYASNLALAIERSGDSSRPTHPARLPVDACRYLGALIAAAVGGASKEELLAPAFWQFGDLDPQIEEIAQGSFLRRQPPEIKGSGFVVRSLEAALWALASTSSFEEGCLRAVNLGYDADTTAAVYGQLAGAIYGEQGIPARWRERVVMAEQISGFADALHDLALADSTRGAPQA